MWPEPDVLQHPRRCPLHGRAVPSWVPARLQPRVSPAVGLGVPIPLSPSHHAPWCPAHSLARPTSHAAHLSLRLCVGRCPPFCGPAGPPTLQYQLLPLPLGIAARRDVLRLTPASSLRLRPVFRLLEPEPDSPFALRSERGRGIISTLRPLREPGTHRLRVQALLPGGQRAPSTFLLLISVSPYPY